MSKSITSLNNLTMFLILNQVKWECKNNSVERKIEDGVFTLNVTNPKTADKSFELLIPVTSHESIAVTTGGGEKIYYTLENIGKIMVDLRERDIISPSVLAKYQESFELAGVPKHIRTDLLVESVKTKTPLMKAFIEFLKDEDIVNTWSIIASSLEGDVSIDIAQIQSEHDNVVSGRYCLFCHRTGNVVDIEISPETLKSTYMPMDQDNFIATHLSASDPKEGDDTDFKRIIGNEKPLESEEDAPVDDKVKYLFPVSEKLLLEDVVSVIVDECNNKLNLHTVVTKLDFDAEAFRIAITSPNRTWLNMIIAEKDGLLYLNYVLTNPSANFNHAVKIDETRTLATVGANHCNVALIRALIQNFVMASPMQMGYTANPMNTEQRATGGFNASPRREASPFPAGTFTGGFGCGHRTPEPTGAQAISAETFTRTAASVFYDCSNRMGSRGYKSRWDALNEVLLINGMEGLSTTDQATITSILPNFSSMAGTLYDLYKVIKAIRPNFEVKGSIPTDFKL